MEERKRILESRLAQGSASMGSLSLTGATQFKCLSMQLTGSMALNQVIRRILCKYHVPSRISDLINLRLNCDH